MASTKEADVSSASVDGESYRERLIVATTATTTMIGSAEYVTVSSTTTTTTSDVLAVSYSPKNQQEQQQTRPSSPLSASVQRPSGNNSVVGGGGETIGGQKLTSKSTVNPHDLPPCCAAPSSPKVINELSPKLGGVAGTNQNSSKGMTRNNASNKEQLKQRKSTEGNTGSNPIHHIAASGAGSSPARQSGTNESASVGTANETGRRTSTTTAPTNNTTTMTARNTTTKPCCFCWCCCYRCTW